MLHAVPFILAILPQQAQAHPLPEDRSGLIVRLWLDDWSHQNRIYDPLFARVTVTNHTENSIKVGSDLCYRASYTITDDAFRYQFESGYVSGLIEPLRMAPGEEWVVDYEVLQTPPVELFNHSFWEDVPDSHSVVEARVGSRVVDATLLDHSLAGRNVAIRLRPPAEMEFIEGLYAEQARRDRENVSYQELGQERDILRPSPRSFGLRGFVPYEDHVQQLLDYERNLSPGSLRDIVHLTRLMRAMYDESEAAKQVAAVDAVLHFLDALPQIQRELLLIRVFDWWPHFSDNPAYFRLADGVLKRMPKKIFEYDDYPAYRLRDTGRDNPDFLEYVERHAGEDYRAVPEPKAEQEETFFGPGGASSDDPFSEN